MFKVAVVSQKCGSGKTTLAKTVAKVGGVMDPAPLGLRLPL